jgi:hypothetical protein
LTVTLIQSGYVLDVGIDLAYEVRPSRTSAQGPKNHFTFIVTLSSAEPTPRIPLTVKVWVAVVVGVTVCLPTGITMSPSRNTRLELVAVQDSVTESPLLIVVRDAVRKAVGRGVEDPPPPHIRRGMQITIRIRMKMARTLNIAPHQQNGRHD